MKTLPKKEKVTKIMEDACPFCGLGESELGTSLLSHVAWRSHQDITWFFMPENEDTTYDIYCQDKEGDYWIIRHGLSYGDTEPQSFQPITAAELVAEINSYIRRLEENIESAKTQIKTLEAQ